MASVTHELPSRRYDGVTPPRFGGDPTPCCWQFPQNLPREDRLTAHAEDVTCRVVEATVPGVSVRPGAVVHLKPDFAHIPPVLRCCYQLPKSRPGELVTPYSRHVTCPGVATPAPSDPVSSR